MDASTLSISQESQNMNSLKRDHDSFAFEALGELETPFTVDSQFATYDSQAGRVGERTSSYLSHPQPTASEERTEPCLVQSGLSFIHHHSQSAPVEHLSSIPTPPISIEPNPPRSPAGSRRSSTTSLTDAASATPSLRGSPPPGSSSAQPSSAQPALATMSGNAPPPPKRAKTLSAQEQEVRRIEKEIKDRERAVEKAKREAEKEIKEQKRAVEKARLEEERAKREAAKEEIKRKKEEEKKNKEEEKKKKERSQKTLNSFFVKPAESARRNSLEGRRSMSPVRSNPGLAVAACSPPAASTPGKKDVSIYDKMFPPFFVQAHVTVAPTNRFERDKEAMESLESMLDGYILHDRSPGRPHTFDVMDLFHLPGPSNIPRGKQFMSVQEIMTEFSGHSSRPIDLTSDSQNTQIKKMGDSLKKIPLKFLKFQEDVRPPYRGTYTSRPKHGITKLARNPFRRDLPTTDYDYDSEAEWVEDEDAEDLESEGGEEEDVEMGEAGDDLDGFLDDEGDESLNSKRLNLQGNVEPVSTGLCWEDHRRRNTNVKMMQYRMEVILGMLHPFPNNPS
jgi:chromatin assembly factor 1 subunit A